MSSEVSLSSVWDFAKEKGLTLAAYARENSNGDSVGLHVGIANPDATGKADRFDTNSPAAKFISRDQILAFIEDKGPDFERLKSQDILNPEQQFDFDNLSIIFGGVEEFLEITRKQNAELETALQAHHNTFA